MAVAPASSDRGANGKVVLGSSFERVADMFFPADFLPPLPPVDNSLLQIFPDLEELELLRPPENFADCRN